MDKAKLGQALQEAAITAAVAFALSFGGFLSGLSKLPNLGDTKAALAAAVVAALVGVGKGIAWFLTGKKV